MSKSWSKSTRYLVLIMVLATLLWLIISIRDLVNAIAISALLAYILNPIVTFVNKRTRVRRNWTVLLVYLLSLGGLVALGIIFIPIIPDQVSYLTSELQIIMEQFQTDYFSQSVTLLNFTIPLNTLIPEVPTLSADLIRPDVILTAIETTTTNVGWLIVILVSTYYLLEDWDKLWIWLVGWAPNGYKSDVQHLYEEVQKVWGLYFRGQLRLSLMIGILTGVASAAVGLRGAVIFGILAAVFDVLVSLGPTFMTGVAAIVALFAGSTFLDVSNVVFMVIVIVIYSTIHVLENIWFRPRIMGQSLHIHPAIVLIAIITSLALAGIMTALIIIPTIASVAVIGRYLHAKIFDLDPWS
ncbi:MAG: AI-2E family transporter [Chloroflexi bacterium]|nr:AI-2E family transporter [Chloroflexota bacterium]